MGFAASPSPPLSLAAKTAPGGGQSRGSGSGSVPIERLTSREYARELRETIDPEQAPPSPPPPALIGGVHTTHHSVVDGEDNAVATTTTLNGPGGSGVVVRGAGFFLNNEMDDFATSAGPNMFGLLQGARNRVEPGKRPLSSMSPTIVLDPAGEVLLVVGGAGGPISLMYETGGLHASARDSLAAMGHTLLDQPGLMNINGIMRVQDGWHGLTQPFPPGIPAQDAGAVGF